MAKGKILRNYLYNTSYQILLIVAPLITSPYIARVLGAANVGIANYVYSVITYFVLFGTIGSSLYGQREVAYCQDDPERRSKVVKEIVVFRFVTVFISIAIYIFTVVLNGKYSLIYLLMLCELIAAAFDISWFFQGMEDFKKTVLRNVIVKIISIALIFILVKTPDDLEKYAVCLTLPTLVGNISLWAYLPRYVVKVKLDFKAVLKRLKPMLLLFLPQIATEVYTVLDKTMIGILSADIAQVGYYTYSQNIVKMLLQVITSLGVVMLPAMSKAFADKQYEKIKEMMGNSFKFVFMFGCPMMFGIAAVANNLVSWFYGDGYSSVGPLMMIISPIILFIGISTVVGKQFLLPTQRQRAFTVSVVIGAIVNFILNLILIPFFSAVGASAATVIAEAMVTAVQIISTRKSLPYVKYLRENIKYLLFGAIMFIPVFMLNNVVSGIIGSVIQVVTGGAIYIALLLVTKDEFLLRYLKTFINKIKKVS